MARLFLLDRVVSLWTCAWKIHASRARAKVQAEVSERDGEQCTCDLVPRMDTDARLMPLPRHWWFPFPTRLHTHKETVSSSGETAASRRWEGRAVSPSRTPVGKCAREELRTAPAQHSTKGKRTKEMRKGFGGVVGEERRGRGVLTEPFLRLVGQKRVLGAIKQGFSQHKKETVKLQYQLYLHKSIELIASPP